MSRPLPRRPMPGRLPRALAIVLLLGASGALSGCGVKGPLEPPPGTLKPGPDGKTPKDTGPVKPDKPFVLDPLL